MATHPTITDRDRVFHDTREDLIRKGYTPEGADETLRFRARIERMRARARERDARDHDNERHEP